MAKQQMVEGKPVEQSNLTDEEIAEAEGHWYTVKDVATLFNFSQQYVSWLCKAKRIKSVKVTGGQWRIPPSEFEGMKREGKPPAKKPPPSLESQAINIPNDKRDKVFPPKKKKEEGEKGKAGRYWPLPFDLD